MFLFGLGGPALASMKVRNLKANHNIVINNTACRLAVLASVKVRNLKANHNLAVYRTRDLPAVLASMKVRNLKANHNGRAFEVDTDKLY